MNKKSFAITLTAAALTMVASVITPAPTPVAAEATYYGDDYDMPNGWRQENIGNDVWYSDYCRVDGTGFYFDLDYETARWSDSQNKKIDYTFFVVVPAGYASVADISNGYATITDFDILAGSMTFELDGYSFTYKDGRSEIEVKNSIGWTVDTIRTSWNSDYYEWSGKR